MAAGGAPVLLVWWTLIITGINCETHEPSSKLSDLKKALPWYNAYLSCKRRHQSLLVPMTTTFGDLDEWLPSNGASVWVGGRYGHTAWKWTDGCGVIRSEGCVDSGQLPVNSRRVYSHSPFHCLLNCRTPFVALWGTECRCLQSPLSKKVKQSLCDVHCADNLGQVCGGLPGYASIYAMQPSTVQWESDGRWGEGECAYLHLPTLSSGDTPDLRLRSDDCQGTVTGQFKQHLCQCLTDDQCDVTRQTNYVTWVTANATCRDQGRQLLNVRTNQSLPLLFHPYVSEDYWVGLNRDFRLMWINGSAAMTHLYRNLRGNKGGFCLSANKGDNGDVIITPVDCSKELPFVCGPEQNTEIINDSELDQTEFCKSPIFVPNRSSSSTTPSHHPSTASQTIVTTPASVASTDSSVVSTTSTVDITQSDSPSTATDKTIEVEDSTPVYTSPGILPQTSANMASVSSSYVAISDSSMLMTAMIPSASMYTVGIDVDSSKYSKPSESAWITTVFVTNSDSAIVYYSSSTPTLESVSKSRSEGRTFVYTSSTKSTPTHTYHSYTGVGDTILPSSTGLTSTAVDGTRPLSDMPDTISTDWGVTILSSTFQYVTSTDMDGIIPSSTFEDVTSTDMSATIPSSSIIDKSNTGFTSPSPTSITDVITTESGGAVLSSAMTYETSTSMDDARPFSTALSKLSTGVSYISPSSVIDMTRTDLSASVLFSSTNSMTIPAEMSFTTIKDEAFISLGGIRPSSAMTVIPDSGGDSTFVHPSSSNPTESNTERTASGEGSSVFSIRVTSNTEDETSATSMFPSSTEHPATIHRTRTFISDVAFTVSNSDTIRTSVATVDPSSRSILSQAESATLSILKSSNTGNQYSPYETQSDMLLSSVESMFMSTPVISKSSLLVVGASTLYTETNIKQESVLHPAATDSFKLETIAKSSYSVSSEFENIRPSFTSAFSTVEVTATPTIASEFTTTVLPTVGSSMSKTTTITADTARFHTSMSVQEASSSYAVSITTSAHTDSISKPMVTPTHVSSSRQLETTAIGTSASASMTPSNVESISQYETVISPTHSSKLTRFETNSMTHTPNTLGFETSTLGLNTRFTSILKTPASNTQPAVTEGHTTLSVFSTHSGITYSSNYPDSFASSIQSSDQTLINTLPPIKTINSVSSINIETSSMVSPPVRSSSVAETSLFTQNSEIVTTLPNSQENVFFTPSSSQFTRVTSTTPGDRKFPESTHPYTDLPTTDTSALRIKVSKKMSLTSDDLMPSVPSTAVFVETASGSGSLLTTQESGFVTTAMISASTQTVSSQVNVESSECEDCKTTTPTSTTQHSSTSTNQQPSLLSSIPILTNEPPSTSKKLATQQMTSSSQPITVTVTEASRTRLLPESSDSNIISTTSNIPPIGTAITSTNPEKESNHHGSTISSIVPTSKLISPVTNVIQSSYHGDPVLMTSMTSSHPPISTTVTNAARVDTSSTESSRHDSHVTHDDHVTPPITIRPTEPPTQNGGVTPDDLFPLYIVVGILSGMVVVIASVVLGVLKHRYGTYVHKRGLRRYAHSTQSTETLRSRETIEADPEFTFTELGDC